MRNISVKSHFYHQVRTSNNFKPSAYIQNLQLMWNFYLKHFSWCRDKEWEAHGNRWLGAIHRFDGQRWRMSWAHLMIFYYYLSCLLLKNNLLHYTCFVHDMVCETVTRIFDHYVSNLHGQMYITTNLISN